MWFVFTLIFKYLLSLSEKSKGDTESDKTKSKSEENACLLFEPIDCIITVCSSVVEKN